MFDGKKRSSASSQGLRHFMLPAHQPMHRTRFPFGTVLLLLAVFGWGLHYKTSLYQDQAQDLHSTLIPPAKLLSDAERILSPKNAVASLVVVPPTRIATFHALAAERVGESAHLAGYLPVPSREQLPEHNPCRDVFIRPPPLV